MDSITEAAKMLNKLCERIGVIDMNAVELCISYLIETCSELENRVRNLEISNERQAEEIARLERGW